MYFPSFLRIYPLLLAVVKRLCYNSFMDIKPCFQDIELFIFDLDGTLYLGNSVIAGAPETVAFLRAAGKKICFLTNNSSKTSAEYMAKLTHMGFEPVPDEFCSSTLVTIDYLKRAGKTQNVYFLAPAAVRHEFIEAGINVITDNHPVGFADTPPPEGCLSLTPTSAPHSSLFIQTIIDNCQSYTVVVGFDTELTYDNIRTACDLLTGGAFFVATHPDKVCPMGHGRSIPDTGSMLKMIEAATGRKPDVICGKPFPSMTGYILKNYGIKDRRYVMMTGDRLSTDIRFGVKNKFIAAAVLTGETALAEIEKSKIKPDYVLGSVNDILSQ